MKKTVLILFLALLLSTSALAANGSYVYDEAGLLSSSEAEELEARAAEIAEETDCGVYIATVEDMTDYGYYSVEDFSEAFYQEYDLGVGSERDGLLLILSMAERDYDLCAFGSFAHRSFTDYGKELLSEEFLDDFSDDDWYGGFSDYLSTSRDYLALSQEGTPVDYGSAPKNPLTTLLIIVVPSVLIAAVVCFIFLGQMKTARRRTSANEYVTDRGVQMYIRQDIFTHRTQQRQVIESNSSKGGTSTNSGGFSHHSGKF